MDTTTTKKKTRNTTKEMDTTTTKMKTRNTTKEMDTTTAKKKIRMRVAMKAQTQKKLPNTSSKISTKTKMGS